MAIPSSIFREYDIRGYVGTELTEDLAYILGRGYARLAIERGKNNIAIGFDCRPSSEPFAKALVRGINDEGLDATITGMGPTPQLYFAVFTGPYGGGIQVTGSHNPSDMNGFKILIGKDTLSGQEIQEIKKRMLALPSELANRRGTTRSLPIQEMYLEDLIKNSKPHIGPRKLKVVVDAGNGVGGMIGPKLLRALGIEIIELFCDPDGSFPNHHPDPSQPENVKALIQKVRETKADLGIGWDGDADRIGVVDEKGSIIFGDMLVLLYAREILKTVPQPTVVADVKCSSLLFSDLEKKGAKPIMWKTGHSLIKSKLKETGAELAGEMSGHIFFKHRFYGFDDALYASARLVELVSHTNKRVSELLQDLPKTVSTPELRIDCPENIKFKIPELAKKAFSEQRVETIDGARINFERGWALIRASNTQPILVLRFEAENEAELESYKTLVFEKLEEIKKSLNS